MSFIRREFYTKDKEIQRYMDKLMDKSIVDLPPRLAMDIGRNKTIRSIRELDRENPLILIGLDRRCNISMIKLREPLKIRKVGDKYIFDL